MTTRVRHRLLLLLGAAAGGACTAPGTVECLWILDGGSHVTTDVSPWWPDAAEGAAEPRRWRFANHCYLIRHRDGLLLWDTGFADEIAGEPDGVPLGPTIRARRDVTLGAQLAAIGIAPRDVRWLALSHFHIDHAGNANRFASATLLVQEEGWRAAFGPRPQRFGYVPALYRELAGAEVVRLHGDHDVFGDDSVRILATPGHTPGHQSLLVRLPRRGTVVLSGDVAHFRANWEARRVPTGNSDRARSIASMQKVAAVLARERAELWIHHDAEQAQRFGALPLRVE